MGTLIKLVILIVIIGVVGYVGVSFYFSCKGPETNALEMPDKIEAEYSFYIENTGQLILANDYEQHGQEIGKRFFMLHGFWELRGKEYQYISGELPLDENIFGIIEVKRRD